MTGGVFGQPALGEKSKAAMSILIDCLFVFRL
jgi:hypothetical protein